MKAITLHQPWAEMVALGAKRIETRSWETRYRGPLAIHAGQCRKYLDVCDQEPFRSVMRAAGIGPADLKFGVVLCERQLVQCLETSLVKQFVQPFTEQEEEFGDYYPGRFAWLLGGSGRFEQPVLAQGHLGLWDWVRRTA